MFKNRYTRRAVLRSGTAVITLPFLDSFGFSRFASAREKATPTPPKRLVFLGMGYGVTKEIWYPDPTKTGSDYELSKALQPLQRHKADVTVIQNLEHRYSNEGHWGSTFWLTGANRYDVPGRSFHNTVSVDQVAAETFGVETRYPSIQLDGDMGGKDGHGPGSSLAWNRQGKPVSAWKKPVDVFHKLFSADDVPLAERKARLKDQQSVLDAVMLDARRVKKGLTRTDRDKIDEYFDSVRDIETRLAKEDQWLDVPKKQPSRPVKKPSPELDGVKAVGVMYDLMAAAMEVDASRVFTYRMPVESFIAELGSTVSAHSMSHYHEGERRQFSEKRDVTHATLLAKFIDRLKATREADGSSLFDHTVTTFGSNLSNVHSLKNCPTLVAGGAAAGFRHGQHLVMGDRERTPLCNLWLSVLNGVGIEAESFGDSDGTIDRLS
ncbi:MAG: DUF1552 domain-containing protein [Planctomycetota bacterium]